jgi:hypothetical protein
MNLREQRVTWEEVEGGNGRGKMMSLYFILKK